MKLNKQEIRWRRRDSRRALRPVWGSQQQLPVESLSSISSSYSNTSSMRSSSTAAARTSWPAVTLVLVSLVCTVLSPYFARHGHYAQAALISVIQVLCLGIFFDMPVKYKVRKLFWLTVLWISAVISALITSSIHQIEVRELLKYETIDSDADSSLRLNLAPDPRMLEDSVPVESREFLYRIHELDLGEPTSASASDL
jgi:hypothetical protein